MKWATFISSSLLAPVLLLGPMNKTASGSSGTGPWFYQRHGEGFGVKGMGYLIRNEAGMLHVLGHPGTMTVSARYQPPQLEGLAPDTPILARWNERNEFVSAASLGVSPGLQLWQVAVDRAEHTYVLGFVTEDAWIKVHGNNHVLRPRGLHDGLLVRCDIKGNIDRYWQLGGSGRVYPSSVIVRADGSVCVTGTFDDQMHVADAARSIRSQGAYDIFVATINAAGGEAGLQRIGGPGHDSVNKITADGERNLYLSGKITGTATCSNGTLSVTQDLVEVERFFVGKLDERGVPIWLAQGSSDRPSDGINVQLDLEGNVVVRGIYRHQIAFGSGTPQPTLAGGDSLDMFVANFSNDGEFLRALRYGPAMFSPGEAGWAVIYDHLWNMYLIQDGPARPTDVDYLVIVQASGRTAATTKKMPAAAGALPPAPTISALAPTPARTLEVYLDGDYSGVCVIEATTDFRQWDACSTNMVVRGRLSIEKSVSPLIPMRFYRVKLRN